MHHVGRAHAARTRARLALSLPASEHDRRDASMALQVQAEYACQAPETMSIIAALLPNQDRLRRLQTAIRGRHQIAPCTDWGALHRLCETQPVATAVFDLFATGEMGLE